MKFEPWLAYTIGAGLCWGTYVPMIAFGGKELRSRYMAFLCVGVAYFLIAVLFPVFRIIVHPTPDVVYMLAMWHSRRQRHGDGSDREHVGDVQEHAASGRFDPQR